MFWENVSMGVIWVMMICAIFGLIGAIRDPSKGIGREFNSAFGYMGIIFIPFAGMLSAMPYIEKGVLFACGKLFEAIGADISVAGALVVAPDMGGYQLTNALSASAETWVIALFVSYLAGPIVAYSIPVGFAMLDKRDYKYFGLGTMSGLLSIPFGVFIMCVFVKFSNIQIRPEISNSMDSTLGLSMSWSQIFFNLIPIVVFCVILALLLRFFMDAMVKGFLVFGRFLEIAVRVVLVLAIIEYFTGFFSMLFEDAWLFQPVIADEVDQFRALEMTGYLILMMAGAFPMVYLLKKYLGKGIKVAGEKIGFSSNGSVAIIASFAEQIIVFGFFDRIRPVDKVKVVAFTVCGAWVFAAHLAVTATFQPNLIGIFIVGKLIAGIIGVLIAIWLGVPAAKKFEAKDRELGIIGENEYTDDEMTAEEIEELTKS